MAVQSEIFSTEYGVRSFISTKHIATKQHMSVWLQRRSDNIWVQLSTSNYELINNSAVLISSPNSTIYSQVEIRVADTPDELGASQSEISIVAGLYDEIVALYEISSDITTVSGISGDVTTVSSNILDINSVVTNIVPNLTEILQADTNATIATTKASEASASATSASNSATTATNQATIATTKASEAAASVTSASNSATSASGSASTATTKASEALASQVAAAASASTASTKASEANTSAGNAASSASTASTQAGIATTKATEASNSASAAATSASTATTKADSATASASAASSSATLASTKAAEADADATSAANSATSASNSATSASNSANTATNKANEASANASSALTSANNANTSETMAYKWSSNPVDTIVETDKYSALHWATKAQQWASTVDTTNFVDRTTNQTISGTKTFSNSPVVPNATTANQSIAYGQAVKNTGDETIDGIKTFLKSPIAPTPMAGDNSTKVATTEFVVSYNAIEQTTIPVIGLMWNQTDDMYKRIGKNVNYLTIDGFNEFSSWRSVTAERQNDSDTVSPSPLTAWLDTSANLPYSGMKRYVISNTGTEVKAYNADSFTHADQTSITSNQQIMVKIPQFNYIQAKIVDGGKTYHIYAVAKSAFTLDALSDLGFMAPVITVWNPTTGVSSGTVAGNVLSSALHPAFVDNAGTTLTKRYYGAFNAVSGRSICGASVRPTASIALATARTQCQGFGAGFTQLDFFLESAKNILALIERGSNYFERGGTSLGNKWEGYSWNTGASSYDQDNGLTLPLLNKTGVILNGSNKTIANSYRGIENYHSALWRWVDGVSLSTNKVYLAKPKATFSDGTITAPYFDSGYTVPSGASASYIADLGAGSFIPVTLGGSASTKVTDGAWTGSTALFVGGALVNASTSGLCAWLSVNPASAVSWAYVSRSGL